MVTNALMSAAYAKLDGTLKGAARAIIFQQAYSELERSLFEGTP
jgi:hypothetical protein